MRFAFHYITWHYSQAILDFIGIVKNFLWFFYNFFSISILLRTLFQPFGRLNETYKKGLDLGAWAETFILNTLMRFVGFVLRMFLIIIGIFFITFTFIFGIFFLLVWILAPVMIVGLVMYGIKLISIG